MYKKISSRLAVVLFGSFLIFKSIFAANTDIVINEIGAYATSTHEWIELWNKGTEPVDLTDWKFWEANTNHGLTATGTHGSVVPAQGYAAIAQDSETFLADHPDFLGALFDSTWGSLSESGEEIGLKDSAGNFIEKFAYVSTTNFSLERRDPNLSDYTAANWQEHVSGNSLGKINSNFLATPITATTTPLPAGQSPLGGALPLSPLPSVVWQKIKLNEFMSDPSSGNEWVELYNTASENIDLTGGSLCDARNTTSTCKTLSGSIAAGGWLFVDLLTASYLNNSGDTLFLKNTDGAVLDQITYDDDLAPDKGQAVARKTDGQDNDNDSDWAITIQPTPGSANTIVVVPTPTIQHSSGSGASAENNSSYSNSATSTMLSVVAGTLSVPPLILNELYPNPPGADTFDEFIEIKNISGTTVDLAGWSLADAAKKISLTGTINPGQILAWERSKTGISLNNTTAEEVRLYHPTGSVADTASYNRAPEGQSYSRADNGSWFWSDEVTKNESNIIDVPDTVKIFWQIVAPDAGELGEMLSFDANGSADPRGGQLHFLWSFSDTSSTFTGEKISRSFATSGIFSITVSATSTAGTADEKEITVAVGRSANGDDAVLLNEIFPNPVGTDRSEFIEIYNNSSTTVNLSGWQIRIKDGKYFTVPDLTALPPHEFLTFYTLATRLHLNNLGDKIQLLSANRQIVDMVKLSQSLPGQSFALTNGEFRWVNTPTPGRTNIPLSPPLPTGQAGSRGESRVLGEKISATTAKISTSFSRLALADARNTEKGRLVRVRGLVTALPNTFGTQFFYLSDDNGGIQIYQNKKDFPELALGDYVEAAGVMSEANGTKRLRLKDKNAVDILAIASNGPLRGAPNLGDPMQLSLDNLSEEALGTLVTITGEITEKKANYIYLDDGTAELKVYFKQGTKINQQQFSLGQKIAVSGILEQSQSGWQLWPRGNDDIKVLGLSEEAAKAQAEAETKNNQTTRNEYLIATASGLVALLAGFFIRKKQKQPS